MRLVKVLLSILTINLIKYALLHILWIDFLHISTHAYENSLFLTFHLSSAFLLTGHKRKSHKISSHPIGSILKPLVVIQQTTYEQHLSTKGMFKVVKGKVH